MRLTLLENGIDFVADAIRRFVGGEDESRYKYVFLSLQAGVALLLKERLRCEHEALIWENIDVPGKRTVGWQKALARVQRYCSATLSRDEIRDLHFLARTRNQMEHYEFQLNEDEVRSRLGRVLAFVLRFMSEHLGEDLREHIEQDTWIELVLIEEFWEQRRSQIAPELESLRCRTLKDGEARLLFDCPECGADAMVNEAGTGRCRMCGHAAKIVSCALCDEVFAEGDLGTDTVIPSDPDEPRWHLCFYHARQLSEED